MAFPTTCAMPSSRTAWDCQRGFWGLVDQHVVVCLVNNQPMLKRDGKPLVEHPDIDFAGLTQAEETVRYWLLRR